MDHAYVETHDLVDAYLAGRLNDDERDAFEAHYFDCAACLEHLEAAEGFREGMRQVAAEDLAQAAAAQARLGLFAALAALSLRHRIALAGFLLLLLALPGLWLAQRHRSLEQQLAAASSAAEQASAERAALEARLRGLEQARADGARRHTEEPAREREEPAAAPQPLQPQVNVPLFLLAAVRSGEQEGHEPVNQIPLPAASSPVIFAAELATVDFPTYRAALRSAAGREVWQAKGLHPDDRDTLVLLFPAPLLQPGVYRLTVEGAQPGGGWSAVASYPLRVIPRPVDRSVTEP